MQNSSSFSSKASSQRVSSIPGIQGPVPINLEEFQDYARRNSKIVGYIGSGKIPDYALILCPSSVLLDKERFEQEDPIEFDPNDTRQDFTVLDRVEFVTALFESFGTHLSEDPVTHNPAGLIHATYEVRPKEDRTVYVRHIDSDASPELLRPSNSVTKSQITDAYGKGFDFKSLTYDQFMSVLTGV